MKFKVGDLVWMSDVCIQKIEEDEYEIEFNPLGEIGAVTNVEDWDEGLSEFTVEWNSGQTNSYLEEDLELYVNYEPYTDEDLERMIG